jgi:hypothetical protein
MGSILVIEPEQLEEVILLGPHPHHPAVQVLVVGTDGRAAAWERACGMLEVYEEQGAFAKGWPGVFIVDVKRGSIRPAVRVERR